MDGKSAGEGWRKTPPVDMRLARAIGSSEGTPEVPIDVQISEVTEVMPLKSMRRRDWGRPQAPQAKLGIERYLGT